MRMSVRGVWVMANTTCLGSEQGFGILMVRNGFWTSKGIPGRCSTMPVVEGAALLGVREFLPLHGCRNRQKASMESTCQGDQIESHQKYRRTSTNSRIHMGR